MKLVLLPGMDGTGKLFAPLMSVLPPEFEPIVVSYSGNEALGWDELQACVEGAIPRTDPYVVLAESFSGPLALRIGAYSAVKPKALIACATFTRNPIPQFGSMFRLLTQMGCFRFSPPQFLVRKFLLGEDCSTALLSTFYEALHEVKPEVLAKRANMILDLDAGDALKECSVPLLYVRATRDRLISLQSVDGMRRLKPAMSIVEIEAPHFVVQREPRRVVTEIQKFLECC